MRAVRGIVRLAALAGLLALLAGVPAGLWHFVGWPLPRRVPTTWAGWEHVLTASFPDAAVANLLAIALWIVWAAFAYSVWVEWRATRGGHRRQLPGLFSPVQALAALLVAAIATGPVAMAAAPPVPMPAVVQIHAGPARTVADLADPHGRWRVAPAVDPPTSTDRPAARAAGIGATPTIGVDAGRPPRFAAAGFDGQLRVQVGNQHYTYTVRRHDTLWDIAGAWLGDHTRWPEIYHLNADRYDRHGRMKHGDHIEPGWVLVLPDDARPPTGAAPASPTPPADQQPPPAPPASPTPPTPGAASPAPSVPATMAPSIPAAPGVGGVPAVTAGPSGTRSAAASPGPTATNASPMSRSPRANPPGVSLPGGSWVDLGLAAAIAAAATLVWIQRRRRYVPRPPSPVLRLDDPDLAPMPPVVTQVRRGLRQATRRQPGDAGIDLVGGPDRPDTDVLDREVELDEDLDLDGDGDLDLDLDQDDGDANGDTDSGDDVEVDTDRPEQAGPHLDPGLAPVVPALEHPLLEVWPPAGLGLTGPGGQAAARGFLVAALAADGLSEPEARGRVVIPAATLATLLGTEAVQVADTPRLTVTAGLPEALEVLEAATLHRTRLVYDHEVDTVAALRDADPLEEPLPPLLLIADATAVHERARIAALLTQGQRLDIHGVLLGVWADGNTVHVDPDGATRPADGDAVRHGGHPADVGRLAVVDPTETADLLRTLAEAHTGQRQPAPPVEALPPTAQPAVEAPNDEKATSAWPRQADSTAGPGRDAEREPTEQPQAVAQPADATATGSPADDQPPTTPHAPAAVVGPADAADTANGEAIDPAAPAHADEPGPQPAGAAANPPAGDRPDGATPRAGRARVFLLGPPRIDNLPPPSRTNPLLRPQAMELLVYLVTHGGHADKDQILDDVLGDAPQKRAPGRLNTYVYSLRRSLKRSAGGAERTYVGTPEQDYTLHRDAIDIDLWRMHDAIASAEAATDPATRIAALRDAVACYTGPLAAGKTYEWIEPYREAVRQQAVDAHLALVAALSDADPAEAVAVLHTAIDHDPYNDSLYQQAMRLHAQLGDIDAIRGLRRGLTRRLGEIDTEPADDTLALADQLITDLQTRPRQPRPLRGDAA